MNILKNQLELSTFKLVYFIYYYRAKACPLDHVCGICLGKLSRVAGIVDQTVGGESNEVTGFLNEKCGQNLSASTD